MINANILKKYLPIVDNFLPVAFGLNSIDNSGNNLSERDIFYKVLIDMKKDVSDLKKIVMGLIENSNNREEFIKENSESINHVLYNDKTVINPAESSIIIPYSKQSNNHPGYIEIQPMDAETDTFNIAEHELEMIKKALIKNNGKRNRAAKELGISERTLYRKIKQFNLD